MSSTKTGKVRSPRKGMHKRTDKKASHGTRQPAALTRLLMRRYSKKAARRPSADACASAIGKCVRIGRAIKVAVSQVMGPMADCSYPLLNEFSHPAHQAPSHRIVNGSVSAARPAADTTPQRMLAEKPPASLTAKPLPLGPRNQPGC